MCVCAQPACLHFQGLLCSIYDTGLVFTCGFMCLFLISLMCAVMAVSRYHCVAGSDENVDGCVYGMHTFARIGLDVYLADQKLEACVWAHDGRRSVNSDSATE